MYLLDSTASGGQAGTKKRDADDVLATAPVSLKINCTQLSKVLTTHIPMYRVTLAGGKRKRMG